MAVRKTKEGASLKRWFKEGWVDVKTGKPCGRKKGEKRGTPYCRPSKRVSSKTPKTASELTPSEKKSRVNHVGLSLLGKKELEKLLKVCYYKTRRVKWLELNKCLIKWEFLREEQKTL